MSNKALKAGFGYTVSNILLKSVGIITLPLFTRLLSTAEYGQYSVFISYSAILLSIMGCSLHASIQSANKEFPGQINEYTATSTFVYFGNLIILAAISLMLPARIVDLLGLSHTQMILLLIYSSGSSFMNLYNARLSLDYSYKKYFALAISSTLGSLLVSVLLMLSVFNSDRFLGRVIGQTVVDVAVVVIALVEIYKRTKPRYNRAYIKFGLKYCLPLIPHGVAQTFLAQFDRIMIKSMVSSAAAGIYSFAGNIKVLLTVISNSLTTVWTTWFFSAMGRGEKKIIQRRAKEFTVGITILTVGVLGISAELIMVLGSSSFWDARYSVIPMVLDAFILFLYQVVVQAEYYSKKTRFVLMGTVVAAVIDVVTNVIFIRKYGYIAAAYTTLFAYMCYLVMHIMIAKKQAGFHIIELRHLILMCTIAFAFGGVTLGLIDFAVIRWGITIVVALILFIYLAKLLAEDKSMTVKEYVQHLIERGKAL